MRYLLIILKILTIAFFLTSCSSARSGDRVFVLAGQSNMQGLGTVYQLKPWQKRTPPNVEFYTRGSKQPVALVSGGRFGPEVNFAHDLARAFPKDRIIIIKVAAGGTPITQWIPGTRNYLAILNQVRHALANSPRTRQVEAILWMQGESDATTQHRASRYDGDLKHIIRQLRRDLRSPHSLFMIGQVNPLAQRFPYVGTVRAKQQQVHNQVPNTQLIPTSDLSKTSDQLHYDTNGQLTLGKRFASAYLRLRPGNPNTQHMAHNY